MYDLSVRMAWVFRRKFDIIMSHVRQLQKIFKGLPFEFDPLAARGSIMRSFFAFAPYVEIPLCRVWLL